MGARKGSLFFISSFFLLGRSVSGGSVQLRGLSKDGKPRALLTRERERDLDLHLYCLFAAVLRV